MIDPRTEARGALSALPPNAFVPRLPAHPQPFLISLFETEGVLAATLGLFGVGIINCALTVDDFGVGDKLPAVSRDCL